MKNTKTCSKCNHTLKLKLFIIVSFLTLIFTAGCNNTESLNTKDLQPGTSNKLTLNIVKDLSKKRDKLSWEDFQTYDSKELGSGLYIKLYPIDDKYELLIGGGSLKKSPMYITLVNKASKKSIDIRHDDIAELINNMP